MSEGLHGLRRSRTPKIPKTTHLVQPRVEKGYGRVLRNKEDDSNNGEQMDERSKVLKHYSENREEIKRGRNTETRKIYEQKE